MYSHRRREVARRAILFPHRAEVPEAGALFLSFHLRQQHRQFNFSELPPATRVRVAGES